MVTKVFIGHSLIVGKRFVQLNEAMSHGGRGTQNGWVAVKSSGKTWAAGGGNGNPLQYSCL